MSPCIISSSTTLQCLNTQVFRHEIFQLCQYTCVRGHSHMESSYSLCQNDAKFHTNPPSTVHFKMPNLWKIDFYDFRYKISVGILMKLFLLSHKCINKLVHKQIYYIASSARIIYISPFLVPALVNYKSF